MSTLLLRFAGPFQSWGSASRFSVRKTEREPTKSGIIGFIAAAMGLERDQPIDEFVNIRYGVRIDQIGEVFRDFHTARTSDGSQAFISSRYYLADAVFLIGIEGDDSLLKEVDKAIKNPVFPLFLGRRSCPPVGPISLGIKYGACVMETLSDIETAPWQASTWYQKKQGKKVYLEIVMDAEAEEEGAFLRSDVPITFSQSHRKYSYRWIISKTNAVVIENPAGKSIHDPMEVI